MENFFSAGMGLAPGHQMMQAMMGNYQGIKDQYQFDSTMRSDKVFLEEDIAQEARFQPFYEEEEYQEIPSCPIPSEEGHDYGNFERKLAQGILDAPKLNLHQVPPSIFDNNPALTIMYLKENHIIELPEYFFDDLPSLAWLDIRDNKLINLPALGNRHEALRVILLQGNKLRALPHTLGLAVNLRTIGLTGNPVTIPPEDVRNKGCKAMLEYLNKRMFMRVPMDEAGEYEVFPTYPDEDEQLRNDLKKTANKSVERKNSSLNPKVSDTSIIHKTEEEKKIDRIKYTWDLWKRVPYDGPNKGEMFRKSLEETKSQVLTNLNSQKEAILQKCKNSEVLQKWRSETRMMQLNSRPRNISDPLVSAPFGNDLNHVVPTVSRILNPHEYQQEVEECWSKLKGFAANPAPLSDTNLALQRLKDVEEIHKRLIDIKVSMKKPGPI